MLKEKLFKRGYAAIEDFLGFEYNEHLSKDSLDNLMDEVYQKMPESTLYKYFAKYNIENTSTVKEFLSMHKGQKISLMTPNGCVDLDGNGTNALLSGQPTNAYPGTNCYAVKVEAVRLLEQKVIRSVFNTIHDSWFILTDYSEF